MSSKYLWAAAAAFVMSMPVYAAPVTFNTPFSNLERRNINSLGFSVGSLVRFGANSVIPNGSSPKTFRWRATHSS